MFESYLRLFVSQTMIRIHTDHLKVVLSMSLVGLVEVKILSN